VRSDEICAWFGQARQPTLEQARVAQLYFTFHPRTAFLKTLGPAAEVVDIGAGDGSLTVFRSWPEPERADLKMYAYSIEKGRYFDDFSGYEISDWNVSRPDFDGKSFDAIVCAHFIEHIEDPASLVAWAASKLKKRGRIYLEWPSPNSLSLPPRKELEELGVPLIISRFDDDDTHRVLPDGDAIVQAMRDSGFTIESRGIVRLPWLEDEMLAHFKDAADGFYRQAAFWSCTGWSQYIVAELPASTELSGPAPRLEIRESPDRGWYAQATALRHALAALQAAHAESVSRARSLEEQLSQAQQSLEEERRRAAGEIAEARRGIAELEEEIRRLTAVHEEQRRRLITAQEEERRRLAADLDGLRRSYEQVLGSHSWKLTRPLRAIANWLRAR
jgi:SAM-dependent methyltransferase